MLQLNTAIYASLRRRITRVLDYPHTRTADGDSKHRKIRSILVSGGDIRELLHVSNLPRSSGFGVAGVMPYALSRHKDLTMTRLMFNGAFAGVVPMAGSTDRVLGSTRLMFNETP
ncbi:hypothetical protein CEK25_010285 [Fusarium fujikuroi]|nr:hypothetical protein CEK25_010285 [Fusarium fujikuroi]